MNILAIETSCDETSAALLNAQKLIYRTASQIDVHRLTGGIVPEVAAREHVQIILPLIDHVLAEANITPQQLDRIAVTSGPGLMTSLMVGVETARTLAYSWNMPIFPVNHIEGHIAANFLEHGILQSKSNIEFPAAALVVSGGHTELLYVPTPGVYELIGATRDDAAGECFDKCARILGLPYPGGPEISKLALTGNNAAIDFPRPMLDKPTYDFSFSGLKTAVLYFMRDHPDALLPDVCASFEQAVVDVLVAKTTKAIKNYNVKSVLVGGGVAANQRLRAGLEALPLPVYIPEPEYCTDNAAMIAAAAWYHSKPTPLFNFRADPNWELTPR